MLRMLLIKLIKYILNIYQTFPITLPFFTIFYGILSINYWLIAFSISAISSNLTNKLIKNIFEFIYKLLNKKYLPILGIGDRPPGAINCCAFIDWTKCNKLSDSFGMPSGHSQLAWFCFIYGTLYMATHIRKTNIDRYKGRIWFIVSSCILLIMAITLSYSRVYLGCHTIQQVILGALIGIGFGLLSFWISSMIIDNDKDVDIFSSVEKVLHAS